MFLKSRIIGCCSSKRPMSKRWFELLRLGKFRIELQDSRLGSITFILPFALHTKIYVRCSLWRSIDINTVLFLSRPPILLCKGRPPHSGKQCTSQIFEFLPRLWRENLFVNKVHCTSHFVSTLRKSHRLRFDYILNNASSQASGADFIYFRVSSGMKSNPFRPRELTTA